MTAENVSGANKPPDLSKWTSAAARESFATKVNGFIDNEVDIRCNDISGMLGLFETTGFSIEDRYYSAMRDKFHLLFGQEISAKLSEDENEYIDVIVKKEGWNDCIIEGGKLTDAGDIEDKYESKKTLVFRFTRD